MENKKFGEIAVEEDTDGKAVWVFEGKIKTDVPLETEADTVVEAINELAGKLQDGGGGDEWQPPEMPEPSAYEIYLLVEVLDVSDSNASMFLLRLASSDGNAYTGYKPLTIDWGDGVINEWNEVKFTQEGYPDYYGWSPQDLRHNYTDVGQYLVKVFGTDYSNFLQEILPQSSAPYSKVIGIKFGSEIIVNDGTDYHDQRAFHNQVRLQYIKMSGKGGLPRQGFYNCRSLKRIDIDILPQKIYSQQFAGCGNLKTFDFSELTEIPDYALTNSGFTEIDLPNCLSIGESGFYNCTNLKKINAPECVSVGANAFTANYSLYTTVFAENCTFGKDSFQNCCLLYPRPDGSIT